MTPAPALVSRPPRLRTLRHTLDIATSHDHDRGVLGLGIVLRAPGKRAGPTLEQHAEAWARFPRGPEDMFAILRALELARERGVRVVRIRWSDNAARVRLYKSRWRGFAGGIRGAVLELAGTFESVELTYVKPRKNVEARALARRALASETLREEHPIFESVPAWEHRGVVPRAEDEWEDTGVDGWETGDEEWIIEGDDDDEIPF